MVSRDSKERLAPSTGASLAKIVSNPVPFNGDGPDIVLNTGFELAETWSHFAPYDGRVRHKYGLDVLYTALPYLGFGVRSDRVVPSSHGKWLAGRCPLAELRLFPDDGHISVLNSAEMALGWLREHSVQR